MDQQLALHWVKNNIDRFSGDNGNVTLFGESAGGWSIWAHRASPGSAGLFEKAIIKSSTAAPLIATPSLRAGEQVGQGLASAVGCAACLRAASAKALVVANLMPAGVDGMGQTLDPEQQRLADQMVRYWIIFARTGTPNGDELPHWPVYETKQDTYLLLETPDPRVTTSFSAGHNCDFWDCSADLITLY